MLNPTRISLCTLPLALTVANLRIPFVQTFATPFGTGKQNCPITFLHERSSLKLRQEARLLQVSLWARTGKNDDEDEDWEPSEKELMNDVQDLSLDDVEDDAEMDDDTMVVINDDNEEESVTVYEDDDIEYDEDLDIWEEDDEEEEEAGEVEEWDEEDEFEKPTSYLGTEVDSDEEVWDEDEGNSDIPLMDDPDDPDYMAQKKLVEETVARREKVRQDKEFDEFDFLFNRMTKDLADELDQTEFVRQTSDIEEKVMQKIKVEDLEGIDLEEEMEETPDIIMDPYDNEGNDNIFNTGLSDDDMERMDDSYRRVQQTLAREPWNKVDYKVEVTDFHSLPNETIQEMDACLDEIGGSSYNCTKWLLYDLDFNVSNLILAAVKHNPEAPIIFQHWFPQLVTYERYQHARDIDFDYSWDDVEKADVEELERYYMGFGYPEIPNKAPAETGMIDFEELDEEELKMAAFENWMTEVYNPEWDKKDFDDDAFQDEDNVFSKFYEEPQHPDRPAYEDMQEDLANWEEELEEEGEENQEYKDMMAKEFKYEYDDDEEFQRVFRGHLIIACAPMDEDVEIAEKITKRMSEEFGKQVFVETRVMAHVREEDNVFEIWLESYEIDLLHSRKRATSGDEGWDGPADCDDDQIEHVVEQVRFLISDDARYSYRFQLDQEMAM